MHMYTCLSYKRQTGVCASTDSSELEAARGPVVACMSFRRAASGGSSGLSG